MDRDKAVELAEAAGDEPIFAAVITPHRSLSPQGFRLLMSLSCVVVAAASIPFLVLGLWPVSGFLGLDVVALYVALRASYRRAGSFEEVVLTRIELLFRRITYRGEAREWRLNPLWTRLERENDEEFGLQQLALVFRGERIAIARDLSPAEREDFAGALGRALAEVKRGR